MFSNLRYVAVASLLVVILAAAGFGYYLRMESLKQIINASNRDVTAAFSSFSSTIWERYSADVINNPASPGAAAFTSETQDFFKPQPFLKVTIFSPDVSRLYFSSTPVYVTSDGSSRITLFEVQKVLSGQHVSRSLPKVYITGSSNPNSPRTMIQHIIPILKPGSNTPHALAEVYTDIGDAWHQSNRMNILMVVTMIGGVSLLAGIFLIGASRAEGIITKQHEVNLELTAAAAAAEAQSQNKSQFLASVSHELRTPLNAIIGFSEIIRNEARDRMEKIHQDYVDDINASGKHLLSLINDILDFSKAEAGKLQVEWAEADATKIIRNSLRMVLPRAEAAQVTLVEDLPSTHLVLVTDAKKLKQVLLNLLSNAVKFTPAGGEVRCHAWTDVVTGGLFIQVKDTGIGIGPKDISRVMTPFGQVDSALSRKYEGTGLGLPLSKKFIESMGGNFAIESQLNVGTSVTISIPKAPPNWDVSSMTSLEEKTDVAPAIPRASFSA